MCGAYGAFASPVAGVTRRGPSLYHTYRGHDQHGTILQETCVCYLLESSACAVVLTECASEVGVGPLLRRSDCTPDVLTPLILRPPRLDLARTHSNCCSTHLRQGGRPDMPSASLLPISVSKRSPVSGMRCHGGSRHEFLLTGRIWSFSSGMIDRHERPVLPCLPSS